jgi:Na+/H+-translocating membrane pyrophosphatase
LSSDDAVPVAILSGTGFNAADVNAYSVTVSGAGITKDDARRTFTMSDVNGDGLQDIVVLFYADYAMTLSSTQLWSERLRLAVCPLKAPDFVVCINNAQLLE